MENRETVRAGTLDEYHNKPDFAAEKDKGSPGAHRRDVPAAHHVRALPLPPHKWGMAIDLNDVHRLQRLRDCLSGGE